MVCLVETDGDNDNSAVLWYGGDEVFVVEQRVSACTLTIQRSSQCMK